MKKILISINPQCVEKILNGEKTIEIRKNIPKCEPPFELYIYCTKPRNYELTGDLFIGNSIALAVLNGSVVAKCIVDKIEHFTTLDGINEHIEKIANESSIDVRDLYDYEEKTIYCKGMYAWHLTNVVNIYYNGLKHLEDFGIEKAPQNRCYIE